ncbi:MAG: TolB-like protein, partial [Myxococcota bacterium]
MTGTRVSISAVTLLAAAWLTTTLTPAHAADPTSRRRVIVYKLQAAPSEAAVAAQLSDTLLLHLGARPGLEVLGESEIQVMLAHQKDKTVLDCDDDTRCLENLERMVDADAVLTGHVGRLGAAWIVTLKLADAKKAVMRAGEAAEADDPDHLGLAVKKAADRLLGLTTESAARFELTLAPEGTKAAVIDLQTHGVDPALGKNLTELLTLELKTFKGMGVVSRSEIQTLLQLETQKQLLGCEDSGCLVEIGGALGVDYLVSGSVGRLGDAYVITLKLMDVHEAHVVNRVSESLRSEASELALALRYATWELLGKAVAGTGALKIRSNVEEGALTVGDRPEAPYPKAAGLVGLTAGKYRVRL